MVSVEWEDTEKRSADILSWRIILGSEILRGSEAWMWPPTYLGKKPGVSYRSWGVSLGLGAAGEGLASLEESGPSLAPFRYPATLMCRGDRFFMLWC